MSKKFLRVTRESRRRQSEHQGHDGHRSCRACHASRDVPASETGSHEHNKEIRSSGEKIKYLGEKTIPFKSIEAVHRCIKFWSANVVKPLISMIKAVQAGNVVVLNDKNPRIRNYQDGSHQAGREQRGVHHGHVGLSR